MELEAARSLSVFIFFHGWRWEFGLPVGGLELEGCPHLGSGISRQVGGLDCVLVFCGRGPWLRQAVRLVWRLVWIWS